MDKIFGLSSTLRSHAAAATAEETTASTKATAKQLTEKIL
jgi:hypothetical protein